LRSSDLFCYAQMIVCICSDRFVSLRVIILLCECTNISRGGTSLSRVFSRRHCAVATLCG
jgi:hypothetical protein